MLNAKIQFLAPLKEARISVTSFQYANFISGNLDSTQT